MVVGKSVTRRRRPVSELEFVGCDPFRVTAAEIVSPEWEGRKVEYWHAATETAWMVREPVSPYHERPSRRLAWLLKEICQLRGSDAVCYGAMDLRIREKDGTLTDIMQADETVYLRPGEAKLPGRSHMIVGEDDYPDVVLEVDNTTDVRRGKLLAYGEWEFPEIWVETPDLASASRPAGRRPGLVIHLLDAGGYRESEESRAFPGWRATEIHRALNEIVTTDETAEALWRVGRALGAREGTRPDDDRLLRKIGSEASARGITEGHARGILEGRAQGFWEMAREILEIRGIAVSPGFVDRLSALGEVPRREIAAAADGAESEADFFARLGKVCS